MKIPIFEWDENKSKANLAKHKVSFDDAAKAYLDPDRIDFYDKEHSKQNEDRWNFIGATAGTVLFVVETEPCENIVRIISARRALKLEREAYYANSEKNRQ
ncbi:MAG: BrnT family toxin [Fibromonadales bacterium]|nr:BrnT family toxin [Fibromonadales bacterium]